MEWGGLHGSSFTNIMGVSMPHTFFLAFYLKNKNVQHSERYTPKETNILKARVLPSLKKKNLLHNSCNWGYFIPAKSFLALSTLQPIATWPRGALTGSHPVLKQLNASKCQCTAANQSASRYSHLLPKWTNLGISSPWSQVSSQVTLTVKCIHFWFATYPEVVPWHAQACHGSCCVFLFTCTWQAHSMWLQIMSFCVAMG